VDKSYQKILDNFCDFEAREIAEKYLKKYWLHEDELNNYWSSIKNNIFAQNHIIYQI
jgi:hypothetical protein